MIKNNLSKFIRWFIRRIHLIPEKDNNYTKWFIIAFFLASSIVSVIYAFGNPTGVTFWTHVTNLGKYLIINGLLYIVWTFIVGAILSILYIPLPRLIIASFSYVIFASVTVLITEDSGTLFSFIIGISYSISWLIITIITILIFKMKKSRIVSIAVLFMVAIFCYLLVQMETKQFTNEVPVIAHVDAKQLPVENPSQPGEYSYTFFTYGSGNDKYRDEFGKNVDIITKSVDASHFITKWGEKREEFWGFDQKQLPINGRAWLPKGEGPFPVILMVHGNHTMEYFSTSGYDYLGELLASRGFIAISVDEDFINYSNVSGIPNNNYELRAWILLKHLVQLKEFNQTPEHVLYEKIDLQNVGLVGHSRGGQAVAMVHDYERYFKDEPWLEELEDIHIKGIVALAPTDKNLDNKKPRLHDVSYLLIQGAQDADISTFRGDHQFYRTTLSAHSDHFKASLYIAGANHSQFNTEWGQMDISLPKGLFLNQMQIMKPEDQRQIAKVYISAFFERVLHENKPYEQLFRNYQYGQNWLPDAILVTKYQNATYYPLVQYKRNEPVLKQAVTTGLEGFSNTEIITPKDRQNNNRPVDAIQLKWDNTATYSINLANWDNRNLENRDTFVFTMANIMEETDSFPEIDIIFETSDGIIVQLPLTEFMVFPPVIKSEFTPFGLFDDIFRNGKYENAWEPVFQTIEIPIAVLENLNGEFDKNNLVSVTLQFHSSPGKILLESVGITR